jgi:isopenicillin N synthase-like dioxygenase
MSNDELNFQDAKEAGIKAINQDFSKYDQVKKDQNYHLVEDKELDQFDNDYEIKVCDLSQYVHGDKKSKELFVHELGSALESIGFAIITGHGVDTSLYEEAQKKIAEIFEDIPLKERLPYKYERNGSVNQGYFPIKETTVIHPDLVEGWVFCRRAFDLDSHITYNEKDYWPRSGYEPFFRQIVQAHEGLILPLMQSILTYLGCDPHLYDEKLTGTNFGFRLNYYPPITSEDDISGAGRMLGHEDVDLFTLLPAQEVEGLQVLNRTNNKWIRLNAPPGSIILNTGDYMQRITNDRLPSTTHRVSKPIDKTLNTKPRISLPMAVYVWEDEILEVLPGLENPKYEPISAIKFHTNITSKYYGDDYAKEVK